MIDLRKIGAVDDGEYNYQLTASTDDKVPVRTGLDDGRDGGPTTAMFKSASTSGHFHVKGGAIVKFDPSAREHPASEIREVIMIKHKAFASTRVIALMLGATFIASGKAMADQVIPDDLIVQGSACVGLDCVNNESFGFDTIRLKENNTRIKFDDTSTLAGLSRPMTGS